MIGRLRAATAAPAALRLAQARPTAAAVCARRALNACSARASGVQGRALHSSAAVAASVASASALPLSSSRPRRALLYMPGSSPKMLSKARTIPGLDCVCMDLEDAVALGAKEAARDNIVQALEAWTDQTRTEKLVRINPVGSGFEQADLEKILSSRVLPDGIVVPKVDCAEHLAAVDAAIVAILGAERARDIILIALVESVEGMINIREIARSSKRLRGFIFGADDYRASVGAIKTASNHEVSWARNLVLLHAKAVGIDAIDLVQTNFRDLALIERESREGAELGYTGKQCIHPAQVDVVQAAFSPDAKSVEWATKVVAEADRQEALGVGAFVVDGLMVDAPLIKKARQIMSKAEACK